MRGKLAGSSSEGRSIPLRRTVEKLPTTLVLRDAGPLRDDFFLLRCCSDSLVGVLSEDGCLLWFMGLGERPFIEEEDPLLKLLLLEKDRHEFSSTTSSCCLDT